MQGNIRLEHNLISVDHDQRLHVMLELAAPAVVGQVRQPMALALVVDRSGSMHGEKLEAAATCAAWLAERLSPEDRLALVSFDDQIAIHVPAVPVASGGVARAVRSLRPGGSTNLSGGFLAGLQLLEPLRDVATRRILLLTDGHANVGIVDPASLVHVAGSAAGRGITTTTIGFGDGFDEDLLTAMADAGRGAAHYAASPDDAAGVFADEADDLAALVAQNVAVSIRTAHPNVTGAALLGDWPVHATGKALRVDLGDAYAGRTRRLVLALDVTGLQDLGPCQVAELVVEYTSIGDEVAQHTLHMPVTVHVASAAEAAAAGIDIEVREEVAILAAARAQQKAIDAAGRGDVVGAKMALRDAAIGLRGVSSGSPRARDLLARADEVEALADLDKWAAKELKSLKFQSHRAGRGRDRK